MNYRLADLLAAKSESSSGTEPIQINLKQPISRISLRWKGTNNGSTPTAHPAAVFKKIEIVDGSKVITALTGYEACGLDLLENKRSRQELLDYATAEMSGVTVNINFGRYFMDEQLALDPTRFQNLMINITHDYSLGGSSPSVGQLRAHAWVMDSPLATPIGYLRSREHQQWTLVASGAQTIDLPVDLPLRMLVMFARYAGYHPWQQINQFKLTQDTDSRVPVNNEYVSDWLSYMSNYFGPIQELMRFIGAASTALTCYITPCYEAVVNPISRSTAGHFVIGLPYGGAVAITPEQAGDDFALVTGYCPHGAIPIPMYRQDSPDAYFDMANRGSLQLVATAGSSCATSSLAQIVTQQLQRY